jgi:hypothetical protein
VWLGPGHPELVMYTVYIPLPLREDADRIVEAASVTFLPGYAFSIRERSDPSEASDGELSFRIDGVAQPEEALERALQVYVAARVTAGLRPDDRAEPSLVPVGSRTDRYR